MDGQALCERLGIDKARLAEWLKAGLPSRGRGARRRFDAAEVADWLREQGLVAERAAMCATVGEVARHFGVTPRAVGYWLATGCPGSPGAYDLGAIGAWREARYGRVEGGNQAERRGRWETRRARAAALKAEHELDELRGRLVNVEAAVHLMERHIGTAKTLFEQLPDFVLSVLPQLPAGSRKAIRDRVAKKVADVCQTLAQALEETAELK